MLLLSLTELKIQSHTQKFLGEGLQIRTSPKKTNLVEFLER